MAQKKSLFFRVARLILLLVCAVYILWTAIKLGKDFSLKQIELVFSWLLLAFPLSLLGLYLQFRAWWALVEESSYEGQQELRKNQSELAALSLYLASQLARYTPGKVGLPALRIAGAPQVGLPRTIVAASILRELVSWLSVGVLISCLSLALLSKESLVELCKLLPLSLPTWSFRGLSLILAFLVAVLLRALTRPLSKQPAWLLRAFEGRSSQASDKQMSREDLEDLPTSLLMHQGLLNRQTYGFHAVYWLSLIATGTCVALSLKTSLVSALVSAAALPIAILGGFFALFAPGGVGIREAILASLSHPFLGATLALTFSLLLRMISLGAEVSLYLCVRLYLKYQQRQ